MTVRKQDRKYRTCHGPEVLSHAPGAPLTTPSDSEGLTSMSGPESKNLRVPVS